MFFSSKATGAPALVLPHTLWRDKRLNLATDSPLTIAARVPTPQGASSHGMAGN